MFKVPDNKICLILKQQPLQTECHYMILDNPGYYPDFFCPPRAVEVDLISVVARPPATLMVALGDEVGWPALVSMTTEALPTTEALALEFDVPKDTNLLFLLVCKIIEVYLSIMGSS
jgi:hypothetical protein